MSDIALERMTQAQFDAWLPRPFAEYARDHMSAGTWSEEEGEERSRGEHEALLPQGLATPDQHLWSIVRLIDREHGRDPVGAVEAGAGAACLRQQHRDRT